MVKKYWFILVIEYLFGISVWAQTNTLPWTNGKLMVSDEHRYLKFENGKPFFWLGNTAWLMPERLNRDEVSNFLERCGKAGYNVVQIQVLNAAPTFNVYGESSMPDSTFDFSNLDKKGVYGYWNHLDYIVKIAENHGIYVGLVCIWGSLVRHGGMNVAQAQLYGEFLGERYKNSPNIIWIIGGDTKGNQNAGEWTALAESIKKVDKNHLMTFHPFGRTMSATWFNNADWLDFNMFQSGHRRYGQKMGDENYPIPDSTEEDSWRYVENSLTFKPMKPVIDGEPSYEGIPKGLHDFSEPLWTADDVRRYVYWSVFAGAFGVTYGNNSIMQFYQPGLAPAYNATEAWWEALDDPGFNQMQYLKDLMLAFPVFDRVPDQSIIVGENGKKYHRLVATRGKDYLLVYNYMADYMRVDLTKITGKKKNVWWYFPKNGKLQYLGQFKSKMTEFNYQQQSNIDDRVLIVIDSLKDYLRKNQKTIMN